LNLADFASIEKFHQEFEKKFDKLDILVNNAAGFAVLADKLTTTEGYELMFGVNHLGHFFLTKV
jgi:NAD(P)-dependent dehydrogenase (short-subunit alcohol dehydrogenase family)